MERIFHLPQPYSVHPFWIVYLAVCSVLLISSRFLKNDWRPLAISTAIVMVLLTFGSGLLSISIELHNSDRFYTFYFPVLITVGLLLLGQYSVSWRGHTGQSTARKYAIAMVLCGAVAASWSIYRCLRYDFGAAHSPLAMVLSEKKYWPAYEWIRSNTPADALFIVDDGIDWSQQEVNDWLKRSYWRKYLYEEDLFQVIAQRRRLYSDRLYGNMLTGQELYSLYLLQYGTFGLPVEKSEYGSLFDRFHPTHILWRKSDRPRTGYWKDLKHDVIHEDEYCEVWSLIPNARSAP